jgi:hypothetical protein
LRDPHIARALPRGRPMANGRKIALGAAAAAAVIGGKEALELSPMLFQGGRTIERGGAEFVGAGGLGGTRTGEIALSRLDETKVFARSFHRSRQRLARP